VGYLTILVVSRLHTALDGRMSDEWRIGNDLEGTICALIKVLFWNMHGGTKENNRKPQTG
jgi:hypothetical protein